MAWTIFHQLNVFINLVAVSFYKLLNKFAKIYYIYILQFT